MSTKQVLVKVKVDDLKPGQKVFISSSADECYLVLDVGHPFILLENLETHWAGLYHPVDDLYLAVDAEVICETPKS